MKINSVLIIDDNEGDRYLLKRQLKDLDLCNKIFEADDGKTALEFLQQTEENSQKHGGYFPPSLIFLDINMPLVNGFEFLEKFDKFKNQIHGYDSIVLMMFTSSQREVDTQKAFSYDCVKGYLTKGLLDPEDFKKTIISCLEKA